MQFKCHLLLSVLDVSLRLTLNASLVESWVEFWMFKQMNISSDYGLVVWMGPWYIMGMIWWQMLTL